MSGDPARWAAALDGAIPAVPLADCPRLVLVAAHPDDETLGAGALLAAAAERGIPTTVVLATLGEASHPASPTHGRAALAAIRRSELAAALQLLAPAAQLVSLGLPDGAIAGHREDLVERLQAVVGAGGTGCWLVANYRGDGHPDHRAVGDAAAEVAGRIGDIVLLEYPLWAWVWTDPADAAVPLDRTLRIATEPAGRLPIHHAAKQRAVAGYRSQLEPLSPAVGDEAVVPLSLLDHLARFGEVFVGDRPPTTPEHAERGDRRSIPGDFFDDQYDASDDPWSFVTSWYERRKRELTLACLPRPQFASVFEPGCSIGTLTAALAPRCRHLLAADVSARALERAAERLRGVDTVEFCRMRVPMEWPDGEFDLVVLSEMAYYLGDSDLDRLIERTLGSLAADGVVVACHWRHPVAEYPLGGDEVHRRLRAVPELALLAEHVEEDFRLDVLVRPPAVSVARREGKA